MSTSDASDTGRQVRVRSALLAAALVVFGTGSPAWGQWDTHWNESGPHPNSCIFNGTQFYAGDEVCVRPRASQACGLDGTLGPIEVAPDCAGAQPPQRSITSDSGRADLACPYRGKKFSVGAEVCSGAGTKLVCKPDGSFAGPEKEANCPAPLSTVP